MQIVFNELSISNSIYDIHDVCSAMDSFVKTFSRITKEHSSISKSISTSEDINLMRLTPDYYIAQWRNHSNVDKDILNRFKIMCDKQDIETELTDELEVSYNNIIGKGLQIAYQNEYPLISFNLDDVWRTSEIQCSVCTMYDEDNSKTSLINFWNETDRKSQTEWLNQRLQSEARDINTPEKIISEIDSLFPSLIFHDNAINQLKSQVQSVHIPIIAERLLKLEQYFSIWDGTAFNYNAFPKKLVSPESKETLRAYKKEHTYVFESEELLVSYHMRYTGNIPGRIFFYPHSAKKKCIICSLTTKLPTVLFPK